MGGSSEKGMGLANKKAPLAATGIGDQRALGPDIE
jgi:hypothetical protein